MRMWSFCVAAVTALLMVEYGAAGNGGRLLVTAPQPGLSDQTVVRERKGDRLPLPTAAQRAPGKPAARDAPPPNPVSKPQPTGHKPALLQGCEPALSPLTGLAPTGLHARCVADAGELTRSPLGRDPAA
jgi:hypothetical protein